MYETGSARTVRAYHVMPGQPLPEGERHPHDYRLDVVISRDRLDDRGMVVDLDRLDAALAEIAETISDTDLEPVVGRAEVTVEAFAEWVHVRLAAALGGPGLTGRVRVWESAVAFGGVTGPLHG